MIHYHGTPMTPQRDAARILAGRHALVSFAYPADLGLVMEVCKSFVLDNGAFSAWRTGRPTLDWQPYYDWVAKWSMSPTLDWALIPDVIDGDEDTNDRLIQEWPLRKFIGVPVWHLHESLDRLVRLCGEWPRVALGSSGEYQVPGTREWWTRMHSVMEAVCVDGFPVAKLHGLRMMRPRIFTRLPLSSADSSSVARGIGRNCKWKGTYLPAGKAARGFVMADRIESQQGAPRWIA